MDSTLVGVTLLSMAMALALSTVVWRLLRDERRRSEARVAALADMMARSAPPASPAPLVSAPASRLRDLPLHRDAREQSVIEPGLGIQDPGPGTEDSGLRTWDEGERTRDSSSPWKARAVVMAALVLVGATGLLIALTLRDRARAEQTSAAAVTAKAPASSAAPLELLSLRDARDATTLTITGAVQNARNGAMLRRVTVTAIAFDRDGGFLASGQALIDVTALAPGDESPFVVSVPVTGNVARYRIGFRGDDGRVIAHVDKRQRNAVASAGPVVPPGT